MKISFDLDGTLFLRDLNHPLIDPSEHLIHEGERISGWRLGTRDLFNALSSRGWEIWIYTQSFRGKSNIIHLFHSIDFPLFGVINKQIHEQQCEVRGVHPVEIPAKMPPWFGINLHVDDLEEISEAGIENGFPVFKIVDDDPFWGEKLLSLADTLEPKQ